MNDFKKHRQAPHIILKFFAMCAGTLALFLLSVVVARAAWGMYGTFKVAVDARDAAQSQLASLQNDQARLSAQVAGFDTPSGIEREMRERFGVVKPGEGEIDIVRGQGSSTAPAAQGQNILTKIFHSLFTW